MRCLLSVFEALIELDDDETSALHNCHRNFTKALLHLVSQGKFLSSFTYMQNDYFYLIITYIQASFGKMLKNLACLLQIKLCHRSEEHECN